MNVAIDAAASQGSVPDRPAVAELMARAEAVAEIIRERAPETEKNRRVSDDTANRLREAGLFRILMPAAYGGYEYGYDVLVDLTSIIGRACGSTAWIFSIINIHQWIMASLPVEAQQEFWADPDSLAAGSYPPVGTTVRVDGGVRTTGSWAFSSGCDVAQWYFLGTMVPPADQQGAPTPKFLMVPRADVRIDDTWHTMGLAGTGSKNLVAEDLFVPEHRAIAVPDLVAGTGPGTLVNTNPLYRQSLLAVLPSALVSSVLGMAEGALNEFVDSVKVRTTRGAMRGGNLRMAEFASVQSRVAEAAASVDAVRLILKRDLGEALAVAQRGEPTPVEMRIRNRRSHAFCARLLMQAVDAVFNASGGQSLHLDKPIQRHWRDAHAGGSHISLNWEAVSTMYGQHALGLEPQGQY